MNPPVVASSHPSKSGLGHYGIFLPLLLAAVFVLALVTYQLYLSNLNAQRAVKTEANNLTQALEFKLNTDFSAAEHSLSWMVSEIGPDAMLMTRVRHYSSRISRGLKDRLGTISSASALRYFDIEGDRLYSSTDDEPGINIADRSFFAYLKAHPESPTVFSGVFFGRATGRATIFAAKPVLGTAGEFLGIAVVAIDLGSLRNLFRTMDLGPQGSVALRRLDNGAAVVRYPGSVDVDNQPAPDLATRQAILGADSFGVLAAKVSAEDPTPRTYGYRKIGDFPFFITIGIAENGHLAGWRADSAALILASVLFLGLLAIAGFRQKRNVENYLAIIDASPAPCLVHDGQGNITYVNAAFTDTFGYTQPEIPTRVEWWSKAYPNPEYRQWVIDLWQRYLENSTPESPQFRSVEIQVRAKNGATRTVLATGSPIDMSHGKRQLMTFYDITARKLLEDGLKQSEASLRVSESQMAASQEIGNTGSWVYDIDTETIHASEHFLAICGFPPGARDFPLEDFLACIEDRDRAAQIIAETIGKERGYDDVFVVSPPDGSPAKVVHALGRLERDERGKASRYLGFLQDITERKRMEDALRQSEASLRISESQMATSQEISNTGSWTYDIATRSVRSSAQGLSIYGFPTDRREYPLDVFLACIEDRDRAAQIIAAAISEERAYEDEYVINPADGSPAKVIRSLGRLERDAQGNPSKFLGFSQDITERKRMEDALRQSEASLRISESQMAASQEISGTGSCVLDYVLKSVCASAQFLALFGLPPVAGDYPLDDFLACVEDPDRLLQVIARAISEWQGYDIEFAVNPADGSPARVIRVIGRHEFDEPGKSSRMLGFMQDITERKRHENELEAAKEAADAANIAKSRFLATMSHEIRTPMNGILGMAQLLQMPELSEALRLDYARTVFSAGQTLLTLLNDILDLSKIEAGKIDLEQVSFAPAELIHDISAIFAATAHQKNLLLEAIWSGPEHRYVGDAHRLRQMISNLVGNALKFTERGSVRIEAREIERDERQAVLEFCVTDTGIGIAQDRQRDLFTPFSQGDSSTTRRHGGSGLGLSIVSRLAQLMDGDVGIESAAGVGSRFWFRIRAGLVASGENTGLVTKDDEEDQGKIKGAVPPQLSGKVLVVEDMPANRTIMEIFLNKLGLSVALAENGQQAIDWITGGGNAALILMDIQMPVVDGYAATERIRQWEAEQGQPRRPIIALTANAFDEDRQRCLAAGIDEVLTKPIIFDDLRTRLVHWLPAACADAAAAAAPARLVRPVDVPRAAALWRELEPLLVDHKFAAVSRFRTLQAMVDGTPLAAEIGDLAQALLELSFDLVLENLRRIAAAEGWEEAA